MNKVRIIFSVLLLVLFCTRISAQQELGIAEVAIEQGDIKKLASILNSTVDITFNNKVNIYSKSQAEAIIKIFFSKNDPKSFKIKYKGESKTNKTLFAIGQMETATSNYRVYMLFTPNKKEYLLRELRFEKLD